ncbi:DNA repair protein recO [Desulfovibrio sp. X2]|uniref:DNA repair protein RecO n=1 Tax=Desulfovibrio sp. X2 TaxID=941449 RepID=UPI0003587270|nr:DNA repair protein RecO [Desulfovibrio sp. X2]EPR42326.1 DNA repair protein recO [Desulfovibrio sp. X2]
MEFTEKALVMKTGRFREADLWVRLLGPNRGLFQAFAFGGSRSRRRFGGCLDAFNLVLVHAGTDRAGRYLQLKEASLVHGYPRLRTDLARLGLAANCLKFAEAVQDGAQSTPVVFETLQGVLELLEGEDRIPEALPLFFRARVLFALGFWPELASCHVCGKRLNDIALAHFGVESGRLACAECGRDLRQRVVLGREAAQTLQLLSRSDPDVWPAFDVSPAVRRECSVAVDRFIEYHLGLVWDSGRYRRI